MNKLKWGGLAFALTLLWLAPPYASYYFSGSLLNSSQIGETFGCVNSLFSGIALLGILYTIILQRNDQSLRSQQFALEQTNLNKQIHHLTLSMRLQVAQQLISMHRTSVTELLPSEKDLPTATLLLSTLKNQLKIENIASNESKQRRSEAVLLIDEILKLQNEISTIRDQIASE